MTLGTAQSIRTTGFSYRGIELPALEIDTASKWMGNDRVTLLPEYNGGMDPAVYEKANGSCPLVWKVGLYQVGRDLHLGLGDAQALPEDVREAGMLVYSQYARAGVYVGGVFHRDAVLFEPGATTGWGPRPGDGFVAARYFRDIKGFEPDGDACKIVPHYDTKELKIWLPPGNGRFIVPTGDGTFHPDAGTPLETLSYRKAAARRWVKMEPGLKTTQANRGLSRFYRADSGVRAVLSGESEKNGPMCILITVEPQQCSRGGCTPDDLDFFGSLPIRRVF